MKYMPGHMENRMPSVRLEDRTLRHLRAYAGGRGLDEAIESLLDARADRLLRSWVAEADAGRWASDA